jgi:hypothetical protein
MQDGQRGGNAAEHETRQLEQAHRSAEAGVLALWAAHVEVLGFAGDRYIIVGGWAGNDHRDASSFGHVLGFGAGVGLDDDRDILTRLSVCPADNP